MSKAKFDFIRYSNCWEDTDNLFKSLEITDKTGLSVLSAGDNTFAMLLKNPKKIVAFDVNKTQIHLFNLKKAGFQCLNYEKLLDLLGIYDTSKSYEIFLTLENSMDAESFEYFKTHKEFFKKGIIHIGKFENYFHIFKKFIVPIFASKRKMRKLASCRDIKIQKKYYENVINNKRLNFIFNIFFGFKVMGKLGRDSAFYDYVENKEDSSKNIKNTFDYGITHIVNYNNQYINYVLTNKFNNDCLPVYLRKENFETIKSRLNKIEVIKASLLDITGKYDFFNLSDIFEYMSEEEFKKNIEILLKLSTENARIVYYNMQNKRYMDNKFNLLKQLSKELTIETKSYFYRDFLVYERKF